MLLLPYNIFIEVTIINTIDIILFVSQKQRTPNIAVKSFI